MQELFRVALTERALPFVSLEGAHEQRLAAAVAAVGGLGCAVVPG